MLGILIGLTTRIVSNSYLNVFQKTLTNSGEKSSVINFYTYLGLTLITGFLTGNLIFSHEILINSLIMGLLGALGNYYIIKALSCGELSILAPINAYKPIIAMIFGIFILNEIPGIKEILGIILIIFGTFLLLNNKFVFSKAIIYRFVALVCSGTEALFIKKVILLSDINSALFYWALFGLIFSLLLTMKHKIKIQKQNIKYQILLIITVGLMQYSTNYIFSKMNVSYALALFQLSAIISVFLGVNIFREKDLLRKIKASVIMIAGALFIILN